MATTGIELGNWFDQEVDKAYSDYQDSAKKNLMFKFAFTEALDKKAGLADTQFEYDELNRLLKTEQEFPLTGGVLDHAIIGDYLHLDFMKVRTLENMGSLRKMEAGEIVFANQNNLLTHGQIKISGSTLPPNMQGEFFVRKIGMYKYKLYLDDTLTQPAMFGVNYQGGGKVERIRWRPATDLRPDTKISRFAKPDPIWARYEQAQGSFKVYPITSDKVKIDYYTKPPLWIDVNSTTDYESVYTLPFLRYIVGVAVKLFMKQTKDQFFPVVKQEIVENP